MNHHLHAQGKCGCMHTLGLLVVWYHTIAMVYFVRYPSRISTSVPFVNQTTICIRKLGKS